MKKVLLALALAAAAPLVWAQPYPSKPVRIIVPFPPGGGIDAVARTIAAKLGDTMKQSFIVENRPGASGTIGAAQVAKAAPDGYTLLVSASTQVINPLIMKTAPYDPVADFTPISYVGNAPLLVVVHPSVPAKSIADLKRLTNANWAINAIGTADHLVAESLRHSLGLPLTIIPYKGQAPAITDTVGGQVTGMSSVVLPVIAHVRDGRLRALAITSAKRNPRLPDLPTVAESGVPGFQLTSWYGLWGPKGLPQPLAETLAAAVKREFQGPDIEKRFPPESFEVVTSTPAEFARFIDEEIARTGRIVREAKISVDNL